MITKPQFRIVIGQDYILTPEKYGENMLVKEFAKAIRTMVATRPFDPNFEKSRDKQQYELYGVERVDERFMKKLVELYNNAMDKGLFNKTAPSMNPIEYFAEGVQSWFDCNGRKQADWTLKQERSFKQRTLIWQHLSPTPLSIPQREGFDWRCPVADSKKKVGVADYLGETEPSNQRACKLPV